MCVPAHSGVHNTHTHTLRSALAIPGLQEPCLPECNEELRGAGQPSPYPKGSGREEQEEDCERHGHTELGWEERGRLCTQATWLEGKGCIT